MSTGCNPFQESDRKEILNAVGKSGQQAYSSVSNDISVSLDLLLKEKYILDKLLYRSKNQHRRGIYFHKLLEIKKRLNKLNSLKIDLIIKEDKPSPQIQTDPDAIIAITTNFEALITFLNEFQHLIATNSFGMLDLVAKGHFVGICVAFLAILSRFRAIIIKLNTSFTTLLSLITTKPEEPTETPKSAPRPITPKTPTTRPKQETKQPKIASTPQTPTATPKNIPPVATPKTPAVTPISKKPATVVTPKNTPPVAAPKTPIPKTPTPPAMAVTPKTAQQATPQKTPQQTMKRKATETQTKDSNSIFEMLLMKKNKKS